VKFLRQLELFVTRLKTALLSLLITHAFAANAAAPGDIAQRAAQHAVATYSTDIITTLAKLVSYNTVVEKGMTASQNPNHAQFRAYLKTEAERLGLDFTDHGHTVIIGLGSGPERVGIITHGDIQPYDTTKWVKSPLVLDQTSEPGRLIGRGTEDDKGPVASALYAMKAVKDQQVVLGKRIELYVYMAEESDSAPLAAFLKENPPPQVNITLDAEYPAVTAEKGWGLIKLTVPNPTGKVAAGQPALTAFAGGFFLSQIPEDASASIANATKALEAQIKRRASKQKGMKYDYRWTGKQLDVIARGVSAHSSKPEDGVNAIGMLADALAVRRWDNTAAAGLVNFLNEMVGTGIVGAKFGKVAYRDDFMGPMTLSPVVIKQGDDGITLNINTRRPRGKTVQQVESEEHAALDAWQARRVKLANIELFAGSPWEQKEATHLPTLMSVFSHYTGIADAKPVSVGGGTNSRLFPKAVSFGPGMPGEVYTGHSEHEFITTKQLLLNLQMYTAVMVELAKAP
jgi:dipeptidase D